MQYVSLTAKLLELKKNFGAPLCVFCGYMIAFGYAANILRELLVINAST